MIGMKDDGSTTLFISIACGYLLLVQLLRYRRHKNLSILYQQNIIDSKDILDQEVARRILSDISGFEFPLIYRISLEFALL